MAIDLNYEKITESELNPSLRTKINNANSHVGDSSIHVSASDRTKWDSGSSIGIASLSKDGLFSTTDRTKFNTIEENANNYVHPKSGISAGTYIITKVNDTGHVIYGEYPTRLELTAANADKLGGTPADAVALLNSPSFTGNPTSPTFGVSESNTNYIATIGFVRNAITSVNSVGYVHPESGVTTALLPDGYVMKDAVSTYSKIATTYTSPVKNWVAKATDTNIYYLYNGSSWVSTDINSLWTGTYIQVTVNRYGHVVSGSNPSSLNVTAANASSLGGSAAALYAKLESPSFSGVPTAPTVNVGTGTNQIATTAYVTNYMSELNGKRPIGEEFVQINPNPPEGCLVYNGGLIDRSSYPKLWSWLSSQTGYMITEALWQEKYSSQDKNVPYYSSGDGTNTFRLPCIGCLVSGSGNDKTIGDYSKNTGVGSSALGAINGVWCVQAYYPSV